MFVIQRVYDILNVILESITSRIVKFGNSYSKVKTDNEDTVDLILKLCMCVWNNFVVFFLL